MASPACNNDIGDLEDMAVDVDVQRIGQRVVVPNPTFRSRRHNEKPASKDIPGTQTIWVKTWGCGHNNSDGEYMAGQLAAYGYRITQVPMEADLWLLNSCTVKNPSEDSMNNAIKKGQSNNKAIVVAGCVPQAAPGAEIYSDYSIVGVQQIDRIVEVVEETLKGHKVRLLKEKKEDGRKVGGAALSLPKIRKNPLIEIVPISTGCLNQCSYCKTKYARGNLGSYPVEEIVERVKQVLAEGVCEIWISSEDTGAYGRDIGTDFPTLLRAILEVMPDGTMLRAGMTNPPYILEHLEAMAEVFHHPRIYKFLHVPVQAASDRVLDVMKREYTCADFRHVTDFLKEKVPGITIATDIICGFPTETPEEFEETLDLIRDYQFAIVNISQFYPRPGTPAARMARVHTAEVKRRSRAITDLFNSFNPYATKVGQKQRVLVTEVSADGKYWVAHNEFYEQVLVPKRPEYLGKMVDVIIKETGRFYLIGEVSEESLVQTPARPKPLEKGAISGSPMPANSESGLEEGQSETLLWKIVGWSVVLGVAVELFRIYRRLR